MRGHHSPEVVGVSAEGNVQLLEKFVHASEKRLGRAGLRFYAGCALKYNDTVSKICRHYEVMFYHKASFLGMQNEPLDNLQNTLCGQ